MNESGVPSGTGGDLPTDSGSDDDLPEIGSRRERLVAYLRFNRDQMIVDLTILTAWVLGSAAVFQMLALPRWLHYLVLFLGVVAYSQVTPSWHRPYESPD